MVRNGRALALGVAVVLVAAVDTGVVLTHGDGPVGAATTTLAAARNATLVTPSGATSPARAGQRVPAGDVVRTGRSGSAELVTRGRAVYLGSDSALAVMDGDHQQLRTGRAVVDALRGPGVRLALAGDQVVVPAGSATEAQRLVSVQVGELAGPAQVISATAQRLAIPGLAQAVIDGDALPSTTTPLHLNDDAGEAAAVPALVTDDEALNELANGINSSGRSTAGVIETAWSGTTAAMPPKTASSERVMPMVIADAAHAGGGSTQSRYDRIVRWRRAGGSWGVVAALLNTDAGAVEAVFNALQRHQPGGQIGTVSIHALAAAPIRGAGAAAASTDGKGGSSGGSGTSHPTSPPAGSGGGHHGGSPTPTPKPTPSTGPASTVIGTVKGVLGTVVGLLPVTVPSPIPTKPSPLPTPTGLLGGLLGGQ